MDAEIQKPNSELPRPRGRTAGLAGRGVYAASGQEGEGRACRNPRAAGAIGPRKRRERRAPIGLLAAGVLLLWLAVMAGAPSARADATSVTNFSLPNTPQALAAAMAQGGRVTFAQDGTITFTNTLVVTNQVQLDANGHAVTLTGGNAVQLFRVAASRFGSPPNSLTLSGLTLTGGRNTNGGALFVDTNSMAILTNCILTGNAASPLLTNVANLGQTNILILPASSTNSVLVTTNSPTPTTNSVFNPFVPFLLTNIFVSTQTSVQTGNVFSITITNPVRGISGIRRSTSTNSITFTNVVTSTNVTLTTNGVGTVLGTNTVADTSIIIESDFAYVTNVLIPASSIIPAPGSDGRAGSDSSWGRGGSGGSGVAGLPGLGGAIFNRGQLSLLNCVLTTNSATGGNGGKGGNGGNGAFRGGNGGNGGKGNNAFGGAVYNDKGGQVFIQNCTFDHNSVTSGSGGTGGAAGSGAPNGLAGNGGAAGLAYGGALYNLGGVTNLASTFSFNQAIGGNSAAAGTASGGGGNTGPRGGNAFGGAIYNVGPLKVTNSTFFANSVAGGNGGDGGPGQSRAGRGGDGGTAGGGALLSANPSSVISTFVINCTFWQNSALGGSNGVAGSGVFPNNTKASPGAVQGGNLARTAGKLQIANSIIGASTTGKDAYGIASSYDRGHNIWSDKSVSLPKKSTSTNNVDPKLGSFGANGGPTLTISLATNSLALGFIPPSNTVSFVDQRGVPRSQGTNGYSDAGSVEETFGPRLVAAPPSQVTQTNGLNATFSITVAGANLKYQWRFNLTNIIAWATGATLTLTNVTPANEGPYDVVVANDYGWLIISPVTTLHVRTFAPDITMEPVTNCVVAPGGTTNFGVTVKGSLPLSYQWYWNGTALPTGTDSTLVISNASAANVGSYTVVVTNLYGAVTSAPPALLTIGTPPTITAQSWPPLPPFPAQQNVPIGSNATFSVAAQGTPPLFYQWLFNGTNLLAGCGTNPATLTISNAQPTNAGTYTVLVTNLFGSITSTPVRLSVLTAPVITSQPASRTVLVGSNVTFQVTANGAQPLSYQWRYNQQDLVGEVAPNYVRTNAQLCDSGTYEVVISNSIYGSTNSSPAVLTVEAPVALSGRLTDVTTAGLGGVTVLLTNQTAVLSTNTDAAGYYVFTNLWPGSTNTVVPVAACQVFQPPFTNVVLGAVDTSSVDFLGFTSNFFSIQGQITNGLTGVSGVNVQLTNASGSQTSTSDARGGYGFSGLCPGTYRLTPSAPGYQFVPPSLGVTLGVGPDASVVVGFAAIPLFTLSGRIVDGSGAGLGGVTVLVNTVNSVQTDANGYFSYANVPAGNYTLMPVLNCYRFAPAAALVAVGAGGANQTNFVATNSVFRLGGQLKLTAGTNLLSGLTLKLVGANQTNLVTTTNGFYLFTGVCAGAYTIEPQPFGAFQFFPATLSGKDVKVDNINLDFVVYGGFSASGRITLLATNPVSGVLVAAVGTNVASAANTGPDGTFHLLALGPGSQDIVPSLAGYQFVPASRRVTLDADTNGVDFAALPLLSLFCTNGGPAQISFPALPGVTYELAASSNLLDWLPLFSTNLDYTNLATSLVLSDPGQFPARFYRLGNATPASSNSPALQVVPAVAR